MSPTRFKILSFVASTVGLSLLCACVTSPVISPSTTNDLTRIPIKNAGFEDDADTKSNCAPGWTCYVHVDHQAFEFAVDQEGAAAGRRSLRLTRIRAEPWAFASQTPDLPKLVGNQTIHFSGSVRTKDVAGLGAGIMLKVFAAEGGPRVKQAFIDGTRAWERLTVSETLPPHTVRVEVSFVLEGEGRAWFDDARLELQR